jgi:hypothetical protein
VAYLSMRYSVFKRLLKSKTYVDLHQTEPVPKALQLTFQVVKASPPLVFDNQNMPRRLGASSRWQR